MTFDVKKLLGGMGLVGLFGMLLVGALLHEHRWKHKCSNCNRRSSTHITQRIAANRHRIGRTKKLFCQRCNTIRTKWNPGPRQRKRWAEDFTFNRPYFDQGITSARPRRALWPTIYR